MFQRRYVLVGILLLNVVGFLAVFSFMNGNTSYAQGTVITPTFNYLAPCPSCSSPSINPVSSAALYPTGNQPAPTGGTYNPAPTTLAPCDTNDNAMTDHKSRHKKHHGAISNLMEQILKFLIELIEMLIGLLGGVGIATPSTPQPAPNPQEPIPSVDTPQPCDPASVPSSAPAPSVVAPSVNPSVPQPSYVPVSVAANPADMIFVGDYETGNFSQWGNCQAVFINASCSGVNGSHYGMQIVTTPVRQGKYAAKYEVHDGDVPDFGGGERAEVSDDAGGATEGQEIWYQWSTQFTPNFPDQGWGAVIGQWHDDSNNSPPISFDTTGEGKFGLTTNGNAVLWSTDQKPGTWHDLKVHIKWSSNASTGFIELWHNGTPQTFTGGNCSGQTKCMTSTMGTGGIYYKQGYYRDAASTTTGVVYLDGFSAAKTEAGLQPL